MASRELGSPGGLVTAAGQLTALFGTYLVLIQLVLMSRSPWLDQVFGMDRLAAAHRWVGFGCVWLLVAHGILTPIGYALGDGSGVVDEAWTLVTTYPFVLWAVVGLGLFIAVAVSSMRAARRRLSYEAWHGIHLYAYLAVALTFAHQLVVGADFADDPIARLYWIGLYVATAATILVFRFGQPIRVSLRHRLRVANVVREAPGVVSIYLTGRELDRLAIRSGQYLVCRFLTRDGWWRGHPFSISAAPNGEWLRVTVKDLGDDSNRLQRLKVGTPVFVEGPYGALTGARRTRSRVLLVAGGHRHHAAPRAARGAAGPAGRDDPHLPGPARRRTSSSAPSSTRSPLRTGRSSTISWAARGTLGHADRAARTGVARRPGPGCRIARRLRLRADPDDARRPALAPRPRGAGEPDPLRTIRVLTEDSTMPKRAVVAISATALALVLLFSFKTPDDPGLDATDGSTGQAVVAPTSRAAAPTTRAVHRLRRPRPAMGRRRPPRRRRRRRTGRSPTGPWPDPS